MPSDARLAQQLVWDSHSLEYRGAMVLTVLERAGYLVLDLLAERNCTLLGPDKSAWCLW